MSKTGACLQINMAPTDIRFVSQTLPHQLRVLGGQVDEIQFTLDTRLRRKDGTRYTTENHADKLAKMRHYLANICKDYPHASIVEVDYSASSVLEVARAFVGGDFIPIKAWNSSPFYAYLYGILRARNDYVFHMDSDMLYGGGSQEWVAEAIDILENNKEMLACYPLGGPPRPDGLLNTEMATWADGWLVGETSVRSDLHHIAFSCPDVSTRVFIFDRRRFLSGEHQVPLVRPKSRRIVKALLFKTSLQLALQDALFLLTVLLDRRRVLSAQPKIPFAPPSWRRRFQSFLIKFSPYLALEDCLSILAFTKGSRYLSFLGSGSGLWSLHLAYRSERLYKELANIIERVETENVPSGQRGDYNLNESMLDWSDVKPATQWARLRDRR